ERDELAIVEAFLPQPLAGEDLETAVQSVVEELEASPRTVAVDGQPVNVNVDAFVNGLRNALYGRASTAWVPYAIHEFAGGNAAPWAAMADAAGGIMDGISFGTLMSVMCGEEEPRLLARGQQPTPTPFNDMDLGFWHDACAVWPAAEPPPELDAPVSSDVPALLLSGALDPVTPPQYGEIAAQTLSNARHVIAPFNAHITTHHGCAPQIFGEFLDTLDPEGLDVSCMEDIGEAPFLLGPAGPTP
ncbi:MAG: alpha/beta hydrolase, partial [Pseudomonadota bacterium]